MQQTIQRLSNDMKAGGGLCDLIGDIHGHASELEALLTKMDYKKNEKGVFQHPDRRIAIFVGDLIDRGPGIREALHIVKNMTDNGNAICILGNHEYNAICFWRQPCMRAHTLKNIDQHSATIHQFKNYDDEWHNVFLPWFHTLPLFLDLPDLRVVHALWDPKVFSLFCDQPKETGKIGKIQMLNSDSTIVPSYWFSQPHHAKGPIENILKGRDIDLPPNVSFADKDGNIRTKSRIRWWKNPVGLTFGQYIEDIEVIDPVILDKLNNIPLPDELIAKMISESLMGYPTDAKALFFGHYWLRLRSTKPVLQEKNVCCLDYSVAKKGNLVAYRWNGKNKDNSLHPDNFVYV